MISPITIQEISVPAEVDLRDLPVGGIHKKAGTTISFSVPISGKPKPTVTWKKDGEDIKQTSRVSTTSSALETTITIKDCRLSDSGVYEIAAKNNAGEKTGINIFLIQCVITGNMTRIS